MKALGVIALAAAALGLAAAGAPAAQRLDVRATVKMVAGPGVKQRGPFKGAPLGAGTLEVTTTVGKGHGALVAFRMYNRRGRVWGSGDVTPVFRGTTVTYTGSARITGGDGAFRNIRGNRLKVSGSGELSDGFAVHLAGPITS